MADNKYTTGSNTGLVLSKITLPGTNGSTIYYLKDTWAREQLESLTSYTKYLGVVIDNENNIFDGSTEQTVKIGEKLIDAEQGNIIVKGSKEFIWNGTQWQEFGDLSALQSALGELAYVDSASAIYTPEGTIAAEFIGNELSVDVDGEISVINEVTFEGKSTPIIATGNIESETIQIQYTPQGTIVNGVFTGDSTQISIEYKPDGTITSTFEGNEETVTVNGIPNGMVKIVEAVAELSEYNYQPKGTVDVNVELEKTTINVSVLSSAGQLPTLSYSALNAKLSTTDEECLNLFFDSELVQFSQGVLPTFTSVSVIDSITVSSATGTFTGSSTYLSATFTGSSTDFTGTFTPSGSISASFSGSSTTLTSTFTPGGSILADFSGSATTLTSTIAAKAITVNGSVTPLGSISTSTSGVTISTTGTIVPSGTISATFTGTSSTITVLSSTSEKN